MKKLWRKHKGLVFATVGLAVLTYAFLSMNSLVFFAGQGASMCSDFDSMDCAIYPGDMVMVALVDSPYYDVEYSDILCYNGFVGSEEETTIVCHRFYGFDDTGNVITMGDCDVSVADTSFISFDSEVGEVLYRFPVVGALSSGLKVGYLTGLEIFNLILNGKYVENVGIKYT